MSKYGKCSCEGNLNPIWFKENEYKDGMKVGRSIDVVSYLICTNCSKSHAVDDSFDSP